MMEAYIQPHESIETPGQVIYTSFEAHAVDKNKNTVGTAFQVESREMKHDFYILQAQMIRYMEKVKPNRVTEFEEGCFYLIEAWQRNCALVCDSLLRVIHMHQSFRSRRIDYYYGKYHFFSQF